jgi:hypothetical protein
VIDMYGRDVWAAGSYEAEAKRMGNLALVVKI